MKESKKAESNISSYGSPAATRTRFALRRVFPLILKHRQNQVPLESRGKDESKVGMVKSAFKRNQTPPSPCPPPPLTKQLLLPPSPAPSRRVEASSLGGEAVCGLGAPHAAESRQGQRPESKGIKWACAGPDVTDCMLRPPRPCLRRDSQSQEPGSWSLFPWFSKKQCMDNTREHRISAPPRTFWVRICIWTTTQVPGIHSEAWVAQLWG